MGEWTVQAATECAPGSLQQLDDGDHEAGIQGEAGENGGVQAIGHPHFQRGELRFHRQSGERRFEIRPRGHGAAGGGAFAERGVQGLGLRLGLFFGKAGGLEAARIGERVARGFHAGERNTLRAR